RVVDAPGSHEDGVPERYDAVIVAGGRSSRLGGVDKTALLWNGVPLRDWALRSLNGAERIAYVGGVAPTALTHSSNLQTARNAPHSPAVIVTREHPPFAGPAAAVQAGLQALPSPSAPWTVVIAADLPRVTAAVAVLLHELRAIGGVDAAGAELQGVIAVDGTSRRQPLLAVYRTSALLAAVHSHSSEKSGLVGLSMRQLLTGLRLHELTLSDALCADVDTPADAVRAGIAVTEPHGVAAADGAR
ncbi:MAG TPA: NTP transferase domain-containing protein, partial [Microterricola sp.]